MRFWYDTEFLEDGRTIDLISIGIVAEDGREFYAVNRDAPWRRIKRHEWLMANVVPHLVRPLPGEARFRTPRRWLINMNDSHVKKRTQIAADVRAFLLGEPQWTENPTPPGPTPVELWAYYGAYDHVVLAQLWGPMVGMPDGLPYWTNDVRQEIHRRSNPAMPEIEGTEHNALADARHVHRMWEWLFRTEAA